MDLSFHNGHNTLSFKCLPITRFTTFATIGLITGLRKVMYVVGNDFGQVKNQYYMKYYAPVKNDCVALIYICNRRIL